jgi:uncharacterized membrane protein YqaE (UPF0057 family)
MLYLIAVVCPPLAVLLCGKPFQALLSILLSLILWFPGVLHAVLVVHDHYENKRARELREALRHRD